MNLIQLWTTEEPRERSCELLRRDPGTSQHVLYFSNILKSARNLQGNKTHGSTLTSFPVVTVMIDDGEWTEQ